jgi:hypothetical protein
MNYTEQNTQQQTSIMQNKTQNAFQEIEYSNYIE